jgi:hypothetical protein
MREAQVNSKTVGKVIKLTEFNDISEHLGAWEDLSLSALEANVFYEHWMLMPALTNLAHQGVSLLFIYEEDVQSGSTPKLIGLVPVQLKRGYRGVPAKILTSWKHSQCFCCTPLVRRGFEEVFFQTLFKWLDESKGTGIFFELKHFRADGPFRNKLEIWMKSSGRIYCETDCHKRALLCPGKDAEEYIEKALERKRRKEYRRLYNRFSELGDLDLAVMESDADVRNWIDEFLTLEASGWKGKQGTAFSSNESERAFFEAVICSAHERGNLLMIAYRLNRTPVAMKIDFCAAEAIYAFKIAYDENYAQYSPGVLLELEHIRYIHKGKNTSWVDSCASPNHPMIDRLWTERRSIATWNLSCGKLMGDLQIRFEPTMKFIYKSLVGVFQHDRTIEN